MQKIAHVAIIGDPQITDSLSYKQLPAPVVSLAQFYCDVYLASLFLSFLN